MMSDVDADIIVYHPYQCFAILANLWDGVGDYLMDGWGDMAAGRSNHTYYHPTPLKGRILDQSIATGHRVCIGGFSQLFAELNQLNWKRELYFAPLVTQNG